MIRKACWLALAFIGCSQSPPLPVAEEVEVESPPFAAPPEWTLAIAAAGAEVRLAIEEATPPPCELGVPDGLGGCTVTPEDRRSALSEDETLAHLLIECANDEYGSFADWWQWEPTEDEARLLALDLNGPGTVFRAMGEIEGTSMIIKVKDAETMENVAVIKTSSSNTRTWAEVYAHRLSTFLCFGELVPDVADLELETGALQKIAEVLEDISYRDVAKEERRQRVLREVRRAVRGEEYFAGAMKPWLGAFMFHGGLGQRDSLGNHPVMRHLSARGAQPDDTLVELRQYTRLYEPRGTHRGRIVMWQLAADLSDIMLMDALMSQNDRFPGANLHFISEAGTRVEDGERRGYPIFDMGTVRLLALDNGAGMRSRNGAGILDLRGQRVRGTRVERFDRVAVQRLRALGRRALGHGCEGTVHPDEVAAIWAYLGLDEERGELAADLMLVVLEYIDDLEARHGEDIYLSPVIAQPEGSGQAAAEREPLVFEGGDPSPEHAEQPLSDVAVSAESSAEATP